MIVVLGGKEVRAAVEDVFAGLPVRLVFPFAGLPIGKSTQVTKPAIVSGDPVFRTAEAGDGRPD